MPNPIDAIVLANVSFEWPDGTLALDSLNGAFSTGRTSLVGANGSGKTTLLRLIAGQLRPTRGTVTTSGTVAYLPQPLTWDEAATVADLLGVAPQVAALHAIESGDVDPAHFDALGDDWDIETRAQEALRTVGLPAFALDRSVGHLSGGEAMLTALAGPLVRRAPITLLDEPTNNLDRVARAMVAEAVAAWPGTLVVVSHDLDLLERVEATAELYDGELTVYGGPYSAWRAALAAQQEAARQAARTARAALKTEQRQRVEAETRLAHRARQAKRDEVNKRAPRIVMHGWASSAQEATGKLRDRLDARVDSARVTAEVAATQVRTEEHIAVDLPDPGVPPGRVIAELHGVNQTIILQGPERIVLVGRNGVGKTTLVEGMLGRRPEAGAKSGGSGPAYGRILVDHVGYLAQRTDGLDPAASALETVQAVAPAVPPGLIRQRLARLLLRGDAALRPITDLSGGERFRVALAQLILADPPPQLLILDEPTNNLDLMSTTHLADALQAYRGALLLVSHDDRFIASLHPMAVYELTAAGALVRAKVGQED
jgi:ATPase subunit of ABC transporter with duplicated ATPase domains